MRSDTERDEALRAAIDGIEATRSAERRRRRLRRVLWVLVFLAALSLVLLLLVSAVIGARDELLDARSAMERGRDQLLEGDAAGAASSFAEGRELFSAAEDRVRGPLLRPVSWLPIVGRTVDSVGAIAGSGATAADAAGVLAEALANLPGGPQALAPSGGRIPVEHIPALAEAAAKADTLMTTAAERLEASPDTLLVGPVGPARAEAETQMEDLRETIHSTAGLLAGLPAFLGAEEPRTYFFGAQNPSELRGTGGHIGAFSILTIDDGEFRFGRFSQIYSIPTPALEDVPPPNEDYATNYDQFRRGGRFWPSINVMPDFPSVAQALLNAYEVGTGERLDGVILADPFALEALLEATGPVEVPGYEVSVDANNVVDFTTNEAYSLFSDSSRRKRVLGDVARAAFTRFVTRPSQDLADLDRLVGAAAERHILVYSEDPALQEALEETPAGGTLVPPGADGGLLAVAVTSSAGSKVDYYQERTIRQTVVLGEDGSADATTELVLHNTAPTSGQPTYVLGTPGQVEEPGDSVALVHVYCGADCAPGESRLDGEPVDTWVRTDLGVRYVQQYYRIGAGERRTLEVGWRDPQAWEGNSSGGTYRMTFGNQVTVRPATVRIRIEPPEGMRIVSTSPEMRVVGGAAVYEGTPGARLDLEVEFGPSLPVRLWRDVVRFLTTPIVDL